LTGLDETIFEISVGIVDAIGACTTSSGVAYYNLDRPHRSLDLAPPICPNVTAPSLLGAIVSRPVPGGLHHVYSREAWTRLHFCPPTARRGRANAQLLAAGRRRPRRQPMGVGGLSERQLPTASCGPVGAHGCPTPATSGAVFLDYVTGDWIGSSFPAPPQLLAGS